MRLPYKLGSLVFASLLMLSCNDDALDFKNNLQPSSDAISLDADTFHLETSVGILESIPSSKNSTDFLLGSYTDDLYGTKTAEILAQINCPKGIILPEQIDRDSSVLSCQVTVSAIQTKGDSVFTIRVYRMDRNTFSEGATYHSNISVSNYCSKNIELGSITNTIAGKLTTARTLAFKLSGALKNELLDSLKVNSASFANDQAFAKFFNGLNLSLDNGSNMMLTVNSIKLVLEYKYKNSGGNATVSSLLFSASKDVRQVNAISASAMPAASDSVIYASSPAGLYGVVKIPVDKIRKRFGVTVENGVAKLPNGSKLNINTAFLNVQVAGVKNSALSTDIEYPETLILVKKSKYKDFFSKTLSPDLSSEMLASYDTLTNSYKFNIPSYLVSEIKNSASVEDELMLVPVDVKVSTSTYGYYYSSVRYNPSFSAVMLKSRNHATSPMKLDVVISGF